MSAKAVQSFHTTACLRGGYGLIQWTTQARYDGRGLFCKKYGCDPSSTEGQTRYMINEMRFRDDLYAFQTNHQTVKYYMNAAYYWLGLGEFTETVHITPILF